MSKILPQQLPHVHLTWLYNEMIACRIPSQARSMTRSTRPLVRILLFLALAVPLTARAQDSAPATEPLAAPAQNKDESIPIAPPLECLGDYDDCLRFFTFCDPLSVRIRVSGNEIGLTEERVRTAVESRLRAARLLMSGPAGTPLSVQVDISSPPRQHISHPGRSF